MNKHDRVERVNTSTMDAIMAEISELPFEEQRDFVFALCRTSDSILPENERMRRMSVAFNNEAFKSWVIAHEDRL
jgi:hypothetical protein